MVAWIVISLIVSFMMIFVKSKPPGVSDKQQKALLITYPEENDKKILPDFLPSSRRNNIEGNDAQNTPIVHDFRNRKDRP